MIVTSEIAGRLPIGGRTGGEQAGRHQLQDAVLRADDFDLTVEARATDHPEKRPSDQANFAASRAGRGLHSAPYRDGGLV